MKVLNLLLLLSTAAFGQTIQNPGFETPHDTIRTLPAGWREEIKAPPTDATDPTLDAAKAWLLKK